MAYDPLAIADAMTNMFYNQMMRSNFTPMYSNAPTSAFGDLFKNLSYPTVNQKQAMPTAIPEPSKETESAKTEAKEDTKKPKSPSVTDTTGLIDPAIIPFLPKVPAPSTPPPTGPEFDPNTGLPIPSPTSQPESDTSLKDTLDAILREINQTPDDIIPQIYDPAEKERRRKYNEEHPPQVMKDGSGGQPQTQAPSVNDAAKNLVGMLSAPTPQAVGDTNTVVAMADLGLDMRDPETMNSIARISSLDKGSLAYITNSLKSVPLAQRNSVLSILTQVLA